MDRLRAMEVFVTVVEQGSFSAASERLGVSTPMVSKYIRGLEQSLKVELIQRSTRRMQVSEAGRVFLDEARQALEQVRRAYERVESLQQAPSGLLRVSAPMTLGASLVAPLVARFLREQPQVRIELVLSNSVVDLMAEGFDVAFRIGELGDVDLIAKPLRPYRMVLCAAPDYLREQGCPQVPADLAEHRLLAHSTWTNRFTWPLRENGREHPWPEHWVLKSNDGQALRLAAIAGNGILMQPHFLVADDLREGRLVSLLEAFLPATRPVSLVYLRQRGALAKLDAFVRFVTQHAS
ncbi:LysR family transcriptional regulator [Pseudomonas entomophila]|uniref:LysR family transcriptional regulator n=1 Tax=Pseudomonas entomophila TaxID=312306 RepID=UPI0023D85B7F|nr:LysR family transcriptional regulator [Pseudomonas entomophila]MDF0729451.1 LysR family transcriptional regulator [Pseudomonas entomophila]